MTGRNALWGVAFSAIVTVCSVEAVRAEEGEGAATARLSVSQVALPEDLRSVLTLYSNGRGGFGLPMTFFIGRLPGRMVAGGDFNGDGIADLAVSEAGSDEAWVLLGDGEGGYGVPIDLPSLPRPTVVAVGDFNGDGIDDRAVASPFSAGVLLLYGPPQGPESLGESDQRVALVAEFDGDGNADLAVIDGVSNRVSIFFGDGGGSVRSATSVPVDPAPTAMAVGDFNGDGVADLALAGGGSDRVSILLGDGEGGFSTGTGVEAGFPSTTVAVGDFDGDGSADLVAADGRSDAVWLLLGDGQGGFGALTYIAIGVSGTGSGMVEATAGDPGYNGPPVAGLTLSPATVAGGSGAFATGTVTLAAPAPAGGTLITLSSSNTDLAASVPSLIVPEGQTSATLTVGTNALYRRNSGLAFTATIIATNPGDASSRSATLTVTAQPRPPAFSSGVKGDREGQICGAVVPFPGDPGILYDCAKGPNPGTSGLCRFKQECTFGCRNLPDDGLKMKAACATSPPFPVVLNPRYQVSGNVSEGTVVLSAPAPDLSGTEFIVTNNNFAAATVVPGNFFQRITGGAARIPFSISTNTVNSPQFAQIGLNLVTADSVSSRTALAWLAVVPSPDTVALPALATLTVNPTSVVGGDTALGTVTLSAPAPAGGANVALGAANGSSFSPPVASVPNLVAVPAGATSATFLITTTPVTVSNGTLIVAAFGGASQTVSLSVTPPPPAGPVLVGLSVSPSTVVGGNPSTGTVTLSAAAPTAGAVVTLTSEPAAGPHVVSVPASLTVPEGASSATFPITTGTVTQSAASTIRATFAGSSLTVVQNVVPLFGQISLSPTTVVGGNPSTGTVTLNGPAPEGGAVVALTSNNTAVATVPASMTVPAGSTSATFTVTTFAVASASSAIITASHGGSTPSQELLTVNPDPAAPPSVSSLSLSPATVVGGNASVGTVTLSAAAPAGGAAVTLSSSNPAVAAVPVSGSVTVPAGATSATFTVTTSTVAASTAVTITAAFGGVSKTATLTVTPPTGPLPAPSLVSPAPDARFLPGQIITFDWTDVSGSASYTIQIDDAEAFTAPLIASATVSVSQYTNGALPVTRMWWRVRADDAAGTPGAWSAVRRFEVKD